MKLFSVILIFCVTAWLLILNNEIYLGFMLMVFTYFTLLIQAASSVRGDFSKTALEIEQFVKSQKKVAFDYLSYPEQLKEIEKRKAQGIRDRKRKIAANKASRAKRTRRIYRRSDNTNTKASFVPWDDDLTPPHAINGLFDDGDDYFIDSSISDNDAFEEIYVNPSTGLIMIGGMGGIDAGGHCWGQSDSFNDSFSCSSFDDSSSSFDDSSNCFSSSLDEW
jgi:hypothetical protein